jgi:hypothetical protein
MRILILTQYYPPEMGAPQTMLSDLAHHLKELGHTVTVLTAMPNYPTGRILPGYRGRWFLKEQSDGINITRTWIYTTEHNNTRKTKDFLQRLMIYCSFVCSSAVVGLWAIGRQDVIIVQSPPPSSSGCQASCSVGSKGPGWS